MNITYCILLLMMNQDLTSSRSFNLLKLIGATFKNMYIPKIFFKLQTNAVATILFTLVILWTGHKNFKVNISMITKKISNKSTIKWLKKWKKNLQRLMESEKLNTDILSTHLECINALSTPNHSSITFSVKTLNI